MPKTPTAISQDDAVAAAAPDTTPEPESASFPTHGSDPAIDAPVDEPSGAALLGAVVADFGGWTRKILAVGEHTVQAAMAAPTRWEHALALPLADAGETLHEVEGLVIKSFRDVGDEIRKVYLNVHGMFVKA